MSIPSISDSISSKSKDEDEDKNEKTERELYQGGIKVMKGLILPGEIEIKDEKPQMYLENNLIKIKNNFPDDIYDQYQKFLSILPIKKKKILTTKYFHLKLMILIFMMDIIHCTII